VTKIKIHLPRGESLISIQSFPDQTSFAHNSSSRANLHSGAPPILAINGFVFSSSFISCPAPPKWPRGWGHGHGRSFPPLTAPHGCLVLSHGGGLLGRCDEDVAHNYINLHLLNTCVYLVPGLDNNRRHCLPRNIQIPVG